MNWVEKCDSIWWTLACMEIIIHHIRVDFKVLTLAQAVTHIFQLDIITIIIIIYSSTRCIRRTPSRLMPLKSYQIILPLMPRMPFSRHRTILTICTRLRPFIRICTAQRLSSTASTHHHPIIHHPSSIMNMATVDTTTQAMEARAMATPTATARQCLRTT